MGAFRASLGSEVPSGIAESDGTISQVVEGLSCTMVIATCDGSEDFLIGCDSAVEEA